MTFREIFRVRKVNNASLRAVPSSRSSCHPHLPGLVHCSLPYSLPDGRSFVAIGCDEGIWVADAADPDFLHRVLDIRGTTEFAVIEQYRIFLVLAEKVRSSATSHSLCLSSARIQSLYCYSLDTLDPYSTNPRVPQLLSGSAPVHFFRVGVWLESLVIAYRKKQALESTIRFLEPVVGASPLKSPIVANLGGDQIVYFRLLKELYIPETCHDLVFLRTQLAVLHPHGGEIIDKETSNAVTILSKNDPRFKSLSKRCKSRPIIGISRTRRGCFLLCFDTFGLIINRYGEPVYDEDHLIDWRGTVYAFTAVSPYIILFKATSLEIRDGTTGALLQVIFGNMRCTWRGPSTLQMSADLDEDSLLPDTVHRRSRVQYVMNAPGHVGVEVAQHVYDLILNDDDPPPPPSPSPLPAASSTHIS